MSGEIAKFIDMVYKADLKMTAQELADVLWLAMKMTPTYEELPAPRQDTLSLPSPPEADVTPPPATVPTSEPEPVAESQIYPYEQDFGSKDEYSQSGKLARMPTASALTGTLPLGSALRPLKRRSRSSNRFVLNVEATVHQIAEMQKKVRIPVVEPAPVRWLELALVIDEGASMIFWQQTIAELRTLLERLGAFRDIRLWGLTTDNEGEVQLYVGAASATEEQRGCDPKELIDPTGRRLILVVTDCVSPAWYSGKVQAILELWGQKNLVTLLQMLPPRLWPRTALCATQPVHIAASPYGIANVLLKIPERAWSARELSVPLPVVTVHKQSLASWARVVTGAENTTTAGVLFTKDPNSVVAMTSSIQSEEHKEVNPHERIRNFRAVASPTAYKLVRLLSAIPIILPVVRVIQQTMFPESAYRYESPQVHIAEVFLGGLLEEKAHLDYKVLHPEYIKYEFLPGVREALNKSLPRADEYQVLREVSSFMERYFGISRDFLAHSAASDSGGDIAISPESRPFASIAIEVWHKLGGDYVQFADKLQWQLKHQERLQHILAAANQAPSEEARIASLNALLALPGIWPLTVVRQALAALRHLESTELREQFLHKLLEHVPEDLRAKVENEIQQPATEEEPADRATPTSEFPEVARDFIVTPPGASAIDRSNERFIKVVCPSCFEEIYLGDCHIISGETGRVLKAAPKGWVQRRLARLRPEGLESYSRERAYRECIRCEYHLPDTIESVRSIALAVVGDVYAGKSHYIASLLQQLTTKWSDHIQGFISLTCLTPKVEEVYRSDYLNPLFVKKRTLPATRPATRATADPLIYQLTAMATPERPPVSYNLIIYDASGEDFQPERLVEFARFVFRAGAFIYVADPVMIPEILGQLPSPLRDNILRSFSPVVTRRTAERMNTTIDLLKRFHRLTDGAASDNPMAVMLSKADLFRYLNELNDQAFTKEPSYEKGLDLQDINAIDHKVRDLLVKYRQADLLAITHNFKHVKFFATSATGGPPDANGNFNNIEPHRCLDPLLWILSHEAIIQVQA